LPGTAGGVSLGSGSLPFKYLVLGGDSLTASSNNFKLTGTATGARTVTFPDASITVARTDAPQILTGTQTISPLANTEAMISNAYTLTGSDAHSLLNLSGTWNTTGNPAAIKLNMVNTTSGSGSLLMDLQV